MDDNFNAFPWIPKQRFDEVTEFVLQTNSKPK